MATGILLWFSCSLVQRQNALVSSGGKSYGDEADTKLPHFELTGKTIGLIGGSGSIGAKVAELSLALGMNVLTFSRNPKPKPGMSVTSSLTDLLSRSDFVSIHCPLNGSTRHMIGKAALASMKPTAYLINTARGAIINELELVEALRNRVIAGAALDVQDPEPPAADSPLLTETQQLNVIITA